MVHVLCCKKTSELSFAPMFSKSSQTAFSSQAPQVCYFVPGATLIHLSSAGMKETPVQSIISTPQHRKLQWFKGSFSMCTAWCKQDCSPFIKKANQKSLANPQDMDVTLWSSHPSHSPPVPQSKAVWRSRCKIKSSISHLTFIWSAVLILYFLFVLRWGKDAVIWQLYKEHNIYLKSCLCLSPH